MTGAIIRLAAKKNSINRLRPIGSASKRFCESMQHDGSAGFRAGVIGRPGHRGWEHATNGNSVSLWATGRQPIAEVVGSQLHHGGAQDSSQMQTVFQSTSDKCMSQQGK